MPDKMQDVLSDRRSHMDGKDIILSLDNIVKTYPGVKALDGVSLDLCRGEIHALVGENGAGKSTLIKICSGALTPDSGTITINGKNFSRITPKQSIDEGIGVIYQELCLIEELSVAENIFMGIPLTDGLFINRELMNQETEKIFEQLHIQLPPDALVSDLSVGYQQIVAIAKALALKAQILIMDEPSAPLTNHEVDALFEIVETLKKNEVSIIYISHRLPEIFQLSDRVTVLRDGKKIKTLITAQTNSEELVRLMVGREMNDIYPEHTSYVSDEKLLEIQNVTGNGVTDISFDVHRGEILGLAGLVGAGRTELAELIFGVKKMTGGHLRYKGKEYDPTSPDKAIETGIALMTEDRKNTGLILSAPIRENVSIAVLRRISKLGLVSRVMEKEIVDRYVQSIRIKTPSIEQPVHHLSGGNQQKVVLAKWLAANPDLIIFDEPTRGIDVGAKHEIYLLMNELIESGKTIIMISSEMEELMGMSDRIVVLYEGKKTGEISRKDFSQERIMAYASNIKGRILEDENGLQ